MSLPADLQEKQDYVHVKHDRVTYPRGFEDSDAFAALGIDNSLVFEDFKKGLSVVVNSKDKDSIQFDLIGVAPAVANALRRVLLARVPTMAITKAKLYQNTSIVQDEVLCHRLGLLPIQVDPRLFEFVSESKNGKANENNTLVFTLDVMCSKKAVVPNDNMEDAANYVNGVVYAHQLKWVPQGEQASRPELIEQPVSVYNPEVILSKLRPGQSIEAELWVQKGVGATHAKFSPVSTASYRLLPKVELSSDTISGAKADAMVKKCPMGVFDIEDSFLTVKNDRNCSMCRECIRDPEDRKLVTLKKKRDTFLFSVETTGAYSPTQVVVEALKVLQDKCDVLKDAIQDEVSA